MFSFKSGQMLWRKPQQLVVTAGQTPGQLTVLQGFCSSLEADIIIHMT